MSTNEQQQPALASQLAGQLARQATERAARQLAQQALTKAAAVVGVKAGALVAVVAVAVIALVLIIVLIVSVAGAPFQNSTAVWPVPVATDSAGLYQASGWSISSRFGWRDDPHSSASEFHDGIDLANPQGRCPFGYHCAAPSIFDGQVQYVGWDLAVTDDPSNTGGGMLVIVNNGQADHQFVYAHLEPYRLYVQLQGRIDDPYGRYDAENSYQPIGSGELQPDLSNGAIEMTCLNDMPNFIPTRSGGGTVLFLYDRPADCITTVVWGQHGDGWQGWIPDSPSGDAEDGQRATLRWQTPIEEGRRAQDVALRFQAHLVPPPPPPTEVPTDTIELTPTPGGSSSGGGWQPPGDTLPTPPPPQAYHGAASSGQGGVAPGMLRVGTPTPAPASAVEVDATAQASPIPAPLRSGKPSSCVKQAGGWVRCTWAFINIPTERERFAAQPNAWVVAAQVYTTTESLHESDIESLPESDRVDDDAIGPTVPAAQLLPSGTALVLTPGPIGTANATPTATPATNLDRRPEAERLTVPALGVGGMAPPPHVQGANATPIPTSDILPTPPPFPGGGTTPPDPGLPPGSGTNPGSGPGSGLDCTPRPLVVLPNVRAPNSRLVEPAAASFALVRAEIIDRTGIDALAVLADVLRAPSFSTDKPGVLNTSWHKAGRAVDLNQGGPFVRVAEGSMFRLYVNNVDVTTIFEAHGWQRIPVQGDTPEWWHYEWHPDGIAWTSAMLQVWDIATLTAAFPAIDWAGVGCAGGSNSGTTNPAISPQEQEQMCLLGSPGYRSSVETFDGCGPPVRAGDPVYQLDTTIGFVGLTGRTTGPHLHLGLKVRSYQGVYAAVNICTPEWLQGRVVPADANCWTEMADPLAFLPQAPGNDLALGGGEEQGQAPDPLQMRQEAATTPTPLIAEGAPYQLPPPNYPNSLVFTPVPDATPMGQYWSPFADGGQYGGGSVGEWFCSVWNGWPWCQ